MKRGRPASSTILWHATPFRGDKFEDAWRPAAAAALDYGATVWAFLRSKDDPLDFTQLAVFARQARLRALLVLGGDRRGARRGARACYQVPVLPIVYRVVGAGELQPLAESG